MVKTLNDILASQGVPPENFPKNEFCPLPPIDLSQTGLNTVLLEDLICKLLVQHGLLRGTQIAEKVCLSLHILNDLLYDMKKRLLLSYNSSVGVGDFIYSLTEKGRQQALIARELTAYVGPAPVLYEEYLECVEQQSIKGENPGIDDLRQALDGLVLPDEFYTLLGPAINSGRGVFLYGKPGNGKTEVAMRISNCFEETIYIPKTLLIEGHLVKLYDPQCHKIIREGNGSDTASFDNRWVKIERPAVIVGGEMEMSSLEIGYNQATRVCEASLQMKGNCGVFVVDDFGRQRVGPEQLLNRWILPLEKRIDFLTLPDGTKFKVPFDALLIFCTNIDPTALLDEAFLRRIPYKICMHDPSEDEFREIFRAATAKYKIRYSEKRTDYLLMNHFRGIRTMRGCHAKDILDQLVNIALFENKEPKMGVRELDRSVELYF